MLTGYFDPADKSAEFKHTWQKLYDYATMNEYQETHYMQALGAILKGEAYEIFTEFKSMDRGLDELLDYFASVYTKKEVWQQTEGQLMNSQGTKMSQLQLAWNEQFW